jgi:hypothetical protein
MKMFGAIIILLNINHVLNASFCSSMFIKSNIQIYNQADIIKTNYNSCLSHPALPIMVQQRKEMFIWQKKQYSAPKNGHLKFCICIKPVIHFCHSTSQGWFLHLNHRFRLQTYVLCSLSLSQTHKVVAAQGTYLLISWLYRPLTAVVPWPP